MASEKDKAEKKRKADAKLQEAAAKKQKDDEEAALWAATFGLQQSAAAAASGDSDDDSDRDGAPCRSEQASLAPSTGQHEPPLTEQVVTPAKDSTLPEYLRFD
eukprot:1956739-Rhodomonas_salina.1